MYRSSKEHSVNINITLIVFEVKNFFEKKQRESLIYSERYEMNIFVAMELCAFYIEYKNIKFTPINFRGRTNVKLVYASTAFVILKSCKSFFHSLVKNNYQINTFSPCEEKDTNTVD